ncbi:GntR family transcriptional regulator, partial [Micromonospora sp. NPDC047548]|uniref:GntR family transcriptional regulator n=1 Tax=Micromonospora sp. NPDC047548 TaxID=3155624 RepID=UPI003406D37C
MSEAAYLQVAREIRDQVASGRLKPGDKLPSFKALCEQYEVSASGRWKILVGGQLSPCSRTAEILLGGQVISV